MDIFQQNWTEKMKNQPFVNKVLNNHLVDIEEVPQDHGRIKYRLIKKYIVKSKDTPARDKIKYRRKTIDTDYTERRATRLKKYPVLKPTDKSPNNEKWHILQKSIRIRKPAPGHNIYHHSDISLWANTRPQSLYNLNYATLR